MFDKGNMFNALRQAQNMKKQLKNVNKQLEKSYFDCNSKNDEGQIKINGKMKIISLKLSAVLNINLISLIFKFFIPIKFSTVRDSIN